MKVSNCLYCDSKNLTSVNRRSDNIRILECAKCHVMMVEHISDDTEQLYTADYFEKSEATKNGYTNYLSSPVANMIGKYGFTSLFATKPSKHLDLGCADGSLMEIFKSEGYQTAGLEISKDAVEIAKLKGLEVTFSNLHTFPENTSKSNVITAFDLLEHSDKPGNVLNEVYKNLEDNGYFVFSTLSVKKEDSSDYWFNNSLEHYVYYDNPSLSYILEDVFGKDRFGFVEMQINGISEFWGFGKKGPLNGEEKILQTVSNGTFFKYDPQMSYGLSLFYNQLSHFAENEEILRYFSKTWSPSTTLLSIFYWCYYQGKYEKAIETVKDKKYLISVNNSVFWQALNYCEEQYFDIKSKDVISAYDSEIINLRGQIFRLKDEVHSLRNSRVIGRIIKTRESVGGVKQKVKKLPLKSAIKIKRSVSKISPEVLKPAVRLIVLKPARMVLRKRNAVKVKKSTTYQETIEHVKNDAWELGNPLVSVVVPFYNRADTIDDTINSLLEQTFIDFEVIIVDDGSTDEVSVEKLEKIKAVHPKFIVMHQKNNGVASARNLGIKKSKGKYIICLDSDDIVEPTYIEKCTTLLEYNQDISLVTTYRKDFGVLNDEFRGVPYEPLELYKNNMVTTAAQFRRKAWEVSGGYKSNIGYEDWDYWLTLAEHGFWGKLLPEPLFVYRVAMSSRFVQDKEAHWNNIKLIQGMHKNYKQRITKISSERRSAKHVSTYGTTFINIDNKSQYIQADKGKIRVLITIPWMTFGGAETLIYNYCREIKNEFDITFATGLKAEHEWEYKFKEITPKIYHLANLFENSKTYIEFLSNYINTRGVDILHIIHNGFTFDMLPELKKRHPHLKVIVTMFNDRVEHFDKSLDYVKYIDTFTSDNEKVTSHYTKALGVGTKSVVIPNGIDCYTTFKLELFERDKERKALGIDDNDIAVFFVGRLSEEKNPDVFVSAAKDILKVNKKSGIKFFVIGDGGMRHEVEESIRAIDSDSISYLGYQSEVAKYLSAADIFVLPSSIEGFPLSILEAMAMKVAVIASDVGAVSEVIENKVDGFVITPGNAKEICEAITTLDNNRKLLADMKILSRKKVEKNYSNKILGKRYTELYMDVK